MFEGDIGDSDGSRRLKKFKITVAMFHQAPCEEQGAWL